MSTKNEILLESGTNEFELIEFILRKRSYGINVAKIREVIEKPDEIYPVPKTHPCMQGVTNIRDEIISIINLKNFLNMEKEDDTAKEKVIITEFNNLKMGFIVDSVTRIYRLSWENVTAPDLSVSGGNAYITSIVKLDKKIILMLDFEKIVMEINQFNDLKEAPNIKRDESRSNYHIVIAEDSTTIRNMMKKNLSEAGYRLTDFSNGKEAYDYVIENKDKIDLLITDIEMPQMDGYSLTKQIKSNRMYSHIPVVIFSSLISPDIRKKGDAVGADAQITKPELAYLLEIVDEIISKLSKKKIRP